jgi:uncharacterized protein (TIGR02147 family)
MINIFDYEKLPDYLSDVLKERRIINSSYSLRSWAMQIGLKSHSPLHSLLNGSRAISSNLRLSLIQNLKLIDQQQNYFHALCDLYLATLKNDNEDQINKLRKILKNLAPLERSEVNAIEAFEIIINPLYMMILELIDRKDFKHEAFWIKNNLRVNIDLSEIQEMINKLVSLGMLEIKNGKFTKTFRHIYTTKEITSMAIQTYHKKILAMAINEISLQQPIQREYQSVTVNIKKSHLESFKEHIRSVVSESIKKFEAAAGEGDATYQFNIQLFSLTKD